MQLTDIIITDVKAINIQFLEDGDANYVIIVQKYCIRNQIKKI